MLLEAIWNLTNIHMSTLITSALRNFVFSTAAVGFLAASASNAKAGCYCMMKSMSIGASASKIGYQGCPGTNDPALIFLTDTEIVDDNYFYNLSGEFTETVSYSDLSVQVDGYNYQTSSGPNLLAFTEQTSEYYSDLSGWEQLSETDYEPSGTCTGSWSCSDPPYSGNCGEAPPWTSFPEAYTVPGTNSSICTPSYSDAKSWYSGSDGVNYSANGLYDDVTVLTYPYTDGMLRQKIISLLPAWPATFVTGTGLAYYDLENRHLSGSGGKMQYFNQVPDSVKDTVYTLQWDQVTGYYDTTNTVSTPMQEDINGTGDPVNPAPGPVHFVDMPGGCCYIYETAPTIIRAVPLGGGGGNPPGSGGPSHGRPR